LIANNRRPVLSGLRDRAKVCHFQPNGGVVAKARVRKLELLARTRSDAIRRDFHCRYSRGAGFSGMDAERGSLESDARLPSTLAGSTSLPKSRRRDYPWNGGGRREPTTARTTSRVEMGRECSIDPDRIELAYGRGVLPIRLPAGVVPTVIRKASLPKFPDPLAAVRQAFESPFASKSLSELA
jgi:hypothetical protein